MKRKLALYGVLIAVIICGLPFVTGILVEVKFKEVINVLEEIDSVPATIKLVDYKRGWRKSHATTKITIYNNRNKKAPPYILMLEHEIRHGPFVQQKDNDYKDWHFARALIHSKLLINEEAKKILLTEVGQTELFNINSEMTIEGIVKIHIDSPTLQLKEQANTQRTAWKGLQGDWVLSADMKRLVGKVVLPGLDFDLNHKHILLNNVTYDTEFTKVAPGLWPGKFAVTFDNLVYEDSQQNFKFNINNTNLRGGMEFHESQAYLIGLLNIEKLVLNDKEYGPIVYSNTLKRIDASVVKSFLGLHRKILTQESLQTSTLQFLIGTLPDLLRTRPEFSIDNLQIETPKGQITGQLRIAVGGPHVANTTSEILQSLAAKASITLPKLILRELLTYVYTSDAVIANEKAKNTLAEAEKSGINSANLPKVLTDAELSQQVENSVNTTLATWLNQKIWLEKDQYYFTNIEVNQGKFLVNGQALSKVPF
ncbi:MAG: DUF945 family protein [Proteobacteria bacterium]|nr:DUF945 family protein [Pseudomonadota bacterium]